MKGRDRGSRVSAYPVSSMTLTIMENLNGREKERKRKRENVDHNIIVLREKMS